MAVTAAVPKAIKERRKASASERSLRVRILDAALEIMRTEGLKRLTQPRVAAAAGIRQSHLTYYFPKKADLIVALLSDHTHGKDGHAKGEHDHHDPEHIDAALELVAFDRRRISFFLNLIVEAENEPALRHMVHEHMTAFDAVVARAYGREVGDPDIEAFVDSLRGCGMKQVLSDAAPTLDIDGLARRFGLERP